MANVTFRNVIHASIHADNADDANRLYEITADVNLCGDTVDSILNGRAVKLGNANAVCEFSANNTPYLNTAFSNMSDTEEQAAALSAVADFIASAKSKAPILGPADE